MPKHYRKLTDTEKAINRFKSEIGHKPTPREMANMFGGEDSQWGRIFKGQCKVSGEYLAIIKLINAGGIDSAQYEIRCAEKSRKYGQRTRKGKIAPHTKNVFNDLENFRIDQIFESRLQNVYFDDPSDYQEFYLNEMERFNAEGPHYSESYEEESKARREFFDSLT
jgi:hypothetical protein